MSIHHKCMDGVGTQRCMGKLVRAVPRVYPQNPAQSTCLPDEIMKSLHSNFFLEAPWRTGPQEAPPPRPRSLAGQPGFLVGLSKEERIN